MPTIITRGAASASALGFSGAPEGRLIFDNWEDLLLIPYNNIASTANRLAFYDYVTGEFVHDISLTAATGSNPTQIFRHFSTGQLIYVSRGSQVVSLVDLRTGDLIWSGTASGYSPVVYAQDKIVSVSKSGTSVTAYTQTIGDLGLSSNIDSHAFMTTSDSTSITAFGNPDGAVAHEINASFEMAQTGDIYFAYSVPDAGAPTYQPKVGLGKINTSNVISTVSSSVISVNLSRPSGANGEDFGQVYIFDGSRSVAFSSSLQALVSVTSSGNGYVRGAGTRNATYPTAKAWHNRYASGGGGSYTGSTYISKYATSGAETSLYGVADSSTNQARGAGVQTTPLGAYIFYSNASGAIKYRVYTAATDSLGGETAFSGTVPWGGSAVVNYSNSTTTTCQVY